MNEEVHRVKGGAELWAAIPGTDGVYEVSSIGRVRSYKRRGTTRIYPTPKMLTVSLDSDGRPAVGVAGRIRRVHNLMLEAFVGQPQPGQEVRHLDGDRTNNRIENLAYGTHAENMADQRAHGTHHFANRTACPQGHPYDAENTRVERTGSRACRECGRRRSNAWKARRRGVAA